MQPAKGFKYGNHPIGLSGRTTALGRPRRHLFNNGAGQTDHNAVRNRNMWRPSIPRTGWTRTYG